MYPAALSVSWIRLRVVLYMSGQRIKPITRPIYIYSHVVNFTIYKYIVYFAIYIYISLYTLYIDNYKILVRREAWGVGQRLWKWHYTCREHSARSLHITSLLVHLAISKMGHMSIAGATRILSFCDYNLVVPQGTVRMNIFLV